MEASNLTMMSAPAQEGGGERIVDPMGRNPFRRISKATMETPIVLAYAAIIVTILTVLYALLGG